jgi:flagellar biosynthesis GTPase FlhF
VTHLLVTKLDDAPDDWTPFEVATDLGLAVRWMTDGQAIPGDIRSAIPRLTKVLLSRRTLRAAP